jgi:hypothetical protein
MMAWRRLSRILRQVPYKYIEPFGRNQHDGVKSRLFQADALQALQVVTHGFGIVAARTKHSVALTKPSAWLGEDVLKANIPSYDIDQ